MYVVVGCIWIHWMYVVIDYVGIRWMHAVVHGDVFLLPIMEWNICVVVCVCNYV